MVSEPQPSESRHQQKVSRQSGQALLEFALVAVVLMMVLFAIIDFSRILIIHEIMINVSREGANLISRGTDATNAITALVTSAKPLNITDNGYIILSSVFNSNGTLRVTSQQKIGGKSAASHVGTTSSTTVSLPNPNLPPPNQTLWVAEVFYVFTPITPLGKLLGVTLPTTNYDAAFF